MTYVHSASPRAVGLNEQQKEALAAMEARGAGALSEWDRGQLAALRLFASEHERPRCDRLVQDNIKVEAKRAVKSKPDDDGAGLLVGRIDGYGNYR